MKDKILEIIEQYPKRFSQLIKQDKELAEWVSSNCLVSSPVFAEQVYSAVNNCSAVCHHNKTKRFISIKNGYGFCGHANTCQCSKENLQKKVSLTKSCVSVCQQQKSNEKRKQTMQEKYGVEYNSQRQELKHIWTKSKVSDYASLCLNDYNWLHNEYNTLGKTLVEIAQDLGIYYSTVAEYCKKHGFPIRQRSNYSLVEKEISAYLHFLNVSHTTGDWDLLETKEIDIYIPAYKLAIEVNGLYWHSWSPGDAKPEFKNKHLEKTLALSTIGIELLHVTDFEWKHKQEIVKNIIKSKLNLNKKIYARKCKLAQITRAEEKLFLTEYHLQGYVPSHTAWGLYLDDQLLQIVTVGKPRYAKQYDLEILRLCTAKNTTVVGGLSRLIRAIKTYYGSNKKIITYCDRDKSHGRGYLAAGFLLESITGPSYCWTDGNVPINRQKCQKKNLLRWLPSFDVQLSESSNMFNAKYRRYWNCGNYIFSI